MPVSRHLLWWAVPTLLAATMPLHANPPAAAYIFPAGGQRGTDVQVRVGGLFLHERCGCEMLGVGVKVTPELHSIKTIWFEGPVIPQPASQRKEDYPKDMGGIVSIAADAPLGLRHWRLWNSEGAASSRKFIIGALPEVLETEIDGEPMPTPVQLPVTINGRIFPREDVDIWTFQAKKGQSFVCEVHANRIGTPLDARMEVHDPRGANVDENDDTHGADPYVRFVAAEDGEYRVHIFDTAYSGGQDFVYRLTITSGPYVEHVYPLGGRRGSKLAMQLSGQGVPDKAELSLSSSPDGPSKHRLEVGGQHSNEFALDLDNLPELLESEPNDAPAGQKPIAFPVVVNGRIEKPGDVDSWLITAKKGEALRLDLRAGRFGSLLNGLLIITDAAGKQLAQADVSAPLTPSPSPPGGEGVRGDAVLDFKAPADGTYCVHVADRFRSRGSRDSAYRLRIAPTPGPDFTLSYVGDAVSVPRGGSAKLKVAATRLGGFNQPITITVDGLPADVSVSGNVMPANKAVVDLVFKAGDAAVIRTAHLTIAGAAEINGEKVKRQAAAELDNVLLGVALPCPFKVEADYLMGFAARGSTGIRRYRIKRNGFDGPIEIRLADAQARHLQGVAGPTVVVPAGVAELDYPVSLPPWMEMGRTCRVCVMGVATIEENGVKHRVSHSSIGQNEQFIAVVGAGQLSMTLKETSILTAQQVDVPVSLKRGEKLQGEIKLELSVPRHIAGISAKPVIIPADRADGVLPIHFDGKCGPFNMPITIRATLTGARPTIAEAKLEVIER